MDIASDIVLPAALALIMFGMGLSLTVADFTRIFSKPAPVIGGLLSILLLLPLAAYFVANAFQLSSLLAIGLILVGACPGGTFSNLFTHYARGDLALSVTLTAVASFFVIFTMPLIVELALAHFLGEQREIALPALDAMRRIFMLTILPVAAGMIANRLAPEFSRKRADLVKNVAGVMIVGVFLNIMYVERETFFAAIRQIAFPVIALNLTSVACGTAIGFLTRSNVLERRTITIEHAVKQEGLGIFVALSLLGKAEMVLPLMLNSFIGLCAGASVMLFARYRNREAANAR